MVVKSGGEEEEILFKERGQNFTGGTQMLLSGRSTKDPHPYTEEVLQDPYEKGPSSESVCKPCHHQRSELSAL